MDGKQRNVLVQGEETLTVQQVAQMIFGTGTDFARQHGERVDICIATLVKFLANGEATNFHENGIYQIRRPQKLQ